MKNRQTNMQLIEISKMQADEIGEAVELVSKAMNPDEGKWADKTMNFHFECMEKGMDD
ncbi:hypothetical protein [uncultured Sunxiuqinia sp.]|uniref:hypothetical protein n=1 Tax=uncultured Sunxiuqinia sp. TaxID=1573825 RepID=UPI002AA68323|nr:hypothetical protein [uncultured Sunxiuqinia sp.]